MTGIDGEWDYQYFIPAKTKSLRLKQLLRHNGVDVKHCSKCHNKRNNNLTIHHINGNHDDNRVSNLQILCEKCHYDLHKHENKNPPHKKKEKTK